MSRDKNISLNPNKAPLKLNNTFKTFIDFKADSLNTLIASKAKRLGLNEKASQKDVCSEAKNNLIETLFYDKNIKLAELCESTNLYEEPNRILSVCQELMQHDEVKALVKFAQDENTKLNFIETIFSTDISKDKKVELVQNFVDIIKKYIKDNLDSPIKSK